jgi:hypothetical protein
MESIEKKRENLVKMSGVLKTEPVFPDEKVDVSLGGLYVLDVEDSAVEEIVKKLSEDEDVFWAYETPERNLAAIPGETRREESVKPAEEHRDKPYGWDPVRKTFDYDHPDDDD